MNEYVKPPVQQDKRKQVEQSTPPPASKKRARKSTFKVQPAQRDGYYRPRLFRRSKPSKDPNAVPPDHFDIVIQAAAGLYLFKFFFAKDMKTNAHDKQIKFPQNRMTNNNSLQTLKCSKQRLVLMRMMKPTL
jgi:hypothetical protein